MSSALGYRPIARARQRSVPTAIPPTRTFLVGCPRSGTTLLQSLLFAHPQVVSFPETFFFVRLLPRDRKRRALHLAHPAAADKLRELEQLTGSSRPRRYSAPMTVRQYASCFTAMLDSQTRQAGGNAWVEKTPIHLHRIEEIETYVPGARFIHLIRAGEAVVASLHDVTRRHPDVWGGERSPAECVDRWRGDLRRSAACAGRPNHAFLAYERLVENPCEAVSRLCDFLGLPLTEEEETAMLRDYRGRAQAVTRDEPWKLGVAGPIENRNKLKLDALFSPSETQEIRRAIDRDRGVYDEIPFL